MKKVAIVGGSLNGNSGAEAMLVTTIARVRDNYGDCKFGIFTPYYKDDSMIWSPEDHENIELINYSPIQLALIIFPLSIVAAFFKFLQLKVLKKLMPKAVQFLWDTDLLVDVGGVSFIDSRITFLPFNVLNIYPGFLFKIPVIKMAQATGPYKKKLNRIAARHCLKKCNQIFARGDKTYAYIEELGIAKEKFSLSTDIAFCNKQGDSLTKENEELNEIIKSLQLNQQTKIGICPSTVVEKISLKDNIDYAGFLTEIIKRLIDDGNFVVIFPNATKAHKIDQRRNNDLPLILDIQKALINDGYKSHQCFTQNLNTDGVKKVIRAIDMVIVSRFHAMVFALTLNKPLFVLGWSHKYLEVMEQFGLEKHVVDFKEGDSDEVIKKVHSILSHKNEIAANIQNKLPEIQNKAFEQIAYLKTLLEAS